MLHQTIGKRVTVFLHHGEEEIVISPGRVKTILVTASVAGTLVEVSKRGIGITQQTSRAGQGPQTSFRFFPWASISEVSSEE